MKWTDEATYDLFRQEVSAAEVTENKILGFGELRNGWHYGAGVSFGHSLLQDAICLNREAIRMAFFETDAFPGIGGEIMVTIYSSDHYLEFILESDGSVTFCRERGGKEICYQEGLSFQEAKDRLLAFRKESWKQSESLVSGITMTGDWVDSRVWPSGTLETLQVSPLSAVSAYSSREEPFAAIFEDTIKEFRMSPQFSGHSQQTYCLVAIG